jgi:Tfp pilus assembly protein PilF
MADLSHADCSVEFVPPNFALAYSALARRISAAYAYLEYEDIPRAKDELREAMTVIEQVETPAAILLSND